MFYADRKNRSNKDQDFFCIVSKIIQNVNSTESVNQAFEINTKIDDMTFYVAYARTFLPILRVRDLYQLNLTVDHWR